MLLGLMNSGRGRDSHREAWEAFRRVALDGHAPRGRGRGGADRQRRYGRSAIHASCAGCGRRTRVDRLTAGGRRLSPKNFLSATYFPSG